MATERCECGCARTKHVEVPGCTACPCTGYVRAAEMPGAARPPEPAVPAGGMGGGSALEERAEAETTRCGQKEGKRACRAPAPRWYVGTTDGPSIPLCEMHADEEREAGVRRVWEREKAGPSSGETPRYPTEADKATRALVCIKCIKGCGQWFLYAPDDREQRKDDLSWLGFVRCPCGAERCISSGSFREDYPKVPKARPFTRDPQGGT